MSGRLKRIVLSTLTIGILTPQLIGCATTSQAEPFQKLEKEDVIEVIQTVTEEEKEFLVETTSEEIESENRMVEEDTSTSVEVDKVEQIEENTENLKETTGIQIVEELNQKMWTTVDCNGYDVDGTNGEATFFHAGYGLTATGLTSNHWYRVETGGYIGYIPVDYLSADESYSLESITAKAEAEARAEAERKAAEEAARLAAQTEAERKAEEEHLAKERAEQQAKESEEQRLLREEQERNAEAARKAEEERLAAEQAAQQQESQQEQQTTQTVENSTTNTAAMGWGAPSPEMLAAMGGTVNVSDDYGTHGNEGEVFDMSDTSEGNTAMKYDPNTVWE